MEFVDFNEFIEFTEFLDFYVQRLLPEQIEHQ